MFSLFFLATTTTTSAPLQTTKATAPSQLVGWNADGAECSNELFNNLNAPNFPEISQANIRYSDVIDLIARGIDDY